MRNGSISVPVLISFVLSPSPSRPFRKDPVFPMPVVGISTSRKAKGARYIRVLEKVGAEPVILRPDPEADIASILDSVDGLVLSGGEDIDPHYYEEPFLDATPDKERDAFEIPLIRAALGRDMPIFGVCRGMEAINVVMGGKLTRKIEGHRSADLVKSVFHDVYIAPGSRLGDLRGCADNAGEQQAPPGVHAGPEGPRAFGLGVRAGRRPDRGRRVPGTHVGRSGSSGTRRESPKTTPRT